MPEFSPMDQMVPTVPAEQRFILSALAPSPAQRRLALAVVIALIIAFLITVGPLSTFQPGRIDALRSPTFCPAVRDNGALWTTAARDARPTARARGAADDRRCGGGRNGARDQAAVVRDDDECRYGRALA